MDKSLIERSQYHLEKIAVAVYYFFVPIVAFFAPIRGVILTVALFIIFDTITGIWKSKKTGQKITSRGLSALITKLFLYEGALLLSYCLDFFIIGELLEVLFSVPTLVTKCTAMLLIFIEAQSVNENYKIAKGVDLWGKFKDFLTRTKEVKQGLDEVLQKTKPNDYIEQDEL